MPTRFEFNYYYLATTPFLVTLLTNIFSGSSFGWLVILPVLMYVCLIVLDSRFPATKLLTPNESQKKISDRLLILVVGLQILCLLSVFLHLFLHPLSLWNLPLIVVNGLTLGIAISAAGHELIHRRGKFLQTVGLVSLFVAQYSWHPIEHIQGHHRNVATDYDPSTAKLNQSFWNYFPKVKYLELREAIDLEAKKFVSKNLPPYSWQNLALRYLSLQIAFAFVIGSIFGVACFFGYILTCFVALFVHSAVVYAQHYGLVRSEGERVGQIHAWQTDSLLTEIGFLGFGNHSDHHLRVTKTFPEIINVEQAPQLPTGYFGILTLVIFPQQWFKKTKFPLKEL